MKIKVSKTDVWVAAMDDRPGGLAELLEVLADAGANLEFIISRRAPEKPGKGVVFVTPIKGVRQVKAAQAAGFKKTGSLHSLRIEGEDQPGLGAKMTTLLARAGINLRGLSAAAFGRRFVCHLALDTAAAAAKAVKALKSIK
jgi:hypothetical protein